MKFRYKIWVIGLVILLNSCSELPLNRTKLISMNYTIIFTKNIESDTIEIYELDKGINFKCDSFYIGVVINYDLQFYTDKTTKWSPIFEHDGYRGTEQILNKIEISNVILYSDTTNTQFINQYKYYTYNNQLFEQSFKFLTIEDYINRFNFDSSLSNAQNKGKNKMNFIWLTNQICSKIEIKNISKLDFFEFYFDNMKIPKKKVPLTFFSN